MVQSLLTPGTCGYCIHHELRVYMYTGLSRLTALTAILASPMLGFGILSLLKVRLLIFPGFSCIQICRSVMSALSTAIVQKLESRIKFYEPL